MMHLSDSTPVVYVSLVKPDLRPKALEIIERWRVNKVKGCLVLHFDGSGQIARITTDNTVNCRISGKNTVY